MLCGKLFSGHRGTGGQGGRRNAGNQQAQRKHQGRRGRDDRDGDGGGRPEDDGDRNRNHRAHEHVGQFVDRRADVTHQLTGVSPHHSVDRSGCEPGVQPLTDVGGST